jgi:DNA-binding NarL/FixJ family response regulator
MRIRRRQTDHSAPGNTTSPGTSDVSFFSVGPDEFAIIPVAGDPAPCLANLSAAETRVLAELAIGRSNREIATSRGTSLRTITNQVSAVFRKLGVRSRSELVLLLSGGKAQEGASERSRGFRASDQSDAERSKPSG